MTDPVTPDTPGEARTRMRPRRQALYPAVGGLAGSLIGYVADHFDRGVGNLPGGNRVAPKLMPPVGPGLTALLPDTVLHARWRL